MTSETEITALTPHWKQITIQLKMRRVGPWWVKNILAAKESQMRTAWARELIEGSVNEKGNEGNDTTSADVNVVK